MSTRNLTRMSNLREAAQNVLLSMEAFRDAVLNQRGSLGEGVLDNDQTNAVLNQFDGDCADALNDLRTALAQSDDKAQPVVPDFDSFVDCDACCGNGFRDVEHQVAERESDVQTFREECETCGATGKEYKGRPLYAVPQPPIEVSRSQRMRNAGYSRRKTGKTAGGLMPDPPDHGRKPLDDAKVNEIISANIFGSIHEPEVDGGEGIIRMTEAAHGITKKEKN